MSVLDGVKKPGRYLEIISVDTGAKERVDIPVHIIKGKNDGPVLLFMAGEHGVEINGVAAIERLIVELNPASLNGTIIAVPSVNTLYIKGRKQPFGIWNTFPKWPGKKNGTPAERITAALTEKIVKCSDVIFNFHAWSWYAASCIFTSGDNPEAVKLAGAFGLPFVQLKPEYTHYCNGKKEALHETDNMLSHYALSNDKPAFLIELLTQYWIDQKSVKIAMRGLRNVMVYLNMIKGEIVLPAAQYETSQEYYVYADRQGLFVPLHELEEEVRAGEAIGYIVDVEKGVKHEVTSPADGVFWLLSRVGKGALTEGTHAYADKGDMLALIKKAEKWEA